MSIQESTNLPTEPRGTGSTQTPGLRTQTPGTETTESSSHQQDGRQRQSDTARQAEHIRKDIESGKERAKREASAVADKVSEKLDETTGRAQQTIRSETQRLQAQGKSYLDEQKNRAADEISHFEGAIHEAAVKLHEEQDEFAACYADSAAEQLHRAASYLRERDAQGLLTDVEDTARARPELVFGGLFVAGLGLARFLKASRRHEGQQQQTRAY